MTRSLVVSHLSKRYLLGTRVKRELWALRDVSFETAPGEILGIIGHNGAGKTTLLKLLSRVTSPTEGRVEGSGRVVPLLSLGAGFQIEATGRENVMLNAAIYGISRTKAEATLPEIVSFADIGDFIDVPVKRYSSGMYLRLAFAVAMSMEPDVLLADEVLAVGDIDFQERCLDRIKDLGGDGKTVLFASHDMAAINRLCDRVLWLNAGEVTMIGTPCEVVSAYEKAAWSTKGLQAQSRKSGSHKNEYGRIGAVSLVTTSGSPLESVTDSDELVVRVPVNIARGGLEASCMMHVFTHGTLAFRSQSATLKVSDAGEHTFCVRIPPRLLAPTVYSVNLDVVLTKRGEGRYPLSAFNALSFRVAPSQAGESVASGVIAPQFDWSFRHVGPAMQPIAEF